MVPTLVVVVLVIVFLGTVVRTVDVDVGAVLSMVVLTVLVDVVVLACCASRDEQARERMDVYEDSGAGKSGAARALGGALLAALVV